MFSKRKLPKPPLSEVAICGVLYSDNFFFSENRDLLSNSSKPNMTCTVNFSGQIEDHPDLLKYSCQVECR